jgi:hypothetical protein
VRYATDAQFRQRVLAASRRWRAVHRVALNAASRRRYAIDPYYRSRYKPGHPAFEAQRLARNTRVAARRKARYGEDAEFREKVRAVNRRWRAAHAVALNAARRRRYADDPRYAAECRAQAARHHHSSHLRRQFGITRADYDAMLRRQAGTCAVCRMRPIARRLAVDHCDTTRLIRGLLCARCNVGLGFYDHSPDLLRAAADYLEAAVARALADPAGAHYAPLRTRAPRPRPRHWGERPQTRTKPGPVTQSTSDAVP